MEHRNSGWPEPFHYLHTLPQDKLLSFLLALSIVNLKNPKFRLYINPKVIFINKTILSAKEKVINKLTNVESVYDENWEIAPSTVNELQEQKR